MMNQADDNIQLSNAKQVSHASRIWRWLFLILLSAAAGWAASTVKMPAAWMVGPMIVSLLFSVIGGQKMRVPGVAFSGSQMVIGVLIAGTFNVKDMPILVRHWYAVLLVSAGTLLISVVIGWVLAKRKVMDRATAFLGVMPGGASGMVAMSSSMDADPKVVALMQYVRLIAVILTASVVTKWLAGPNLASHPSVTAGASHTGWFSWCISLLIGAIGAWAGRNSVYLPVPCWVPWHWG